MTATELTGQSLLQAVLDDPADDTVRLVYAERRCGYAVCASFSPRKWANEKIKNPCLQ